MIPQKSKEKHYKLILSSLKGVKLNALQISKETGLTQHQVSRRMSELRHESKVIEVGYSRVLRNGIFRKFTLYTQKV